MILSSGYPGSEEGQGKGREEYSRRTQQNLNLYLLYFDCPKMFRDVPEWTFRGCPPMWLAALVRVLPLQVTWLLLDALQAVIPDLQMCRQDDQKFRVVFGYIGSSRAAT